MKRVLFLSLALMVLVLPAAVAGDKGELPEGQASANIQVSGMTCGACCNKVETAVAKLDGVVKVKADYEKGVANVVFETAKTDVNKIVEAINTETTFKAKAPKEKTT